MGSTPIGSNWRMVESKGKIDGLTPHQPIRIFLNFISLVGFLSKASKKKTVAVKNCRTNGIKYIGAIATCTTSRGRRANLSGIDKENTICNSECMV